MTKTPPLRSHKMLTATESMIVRLLVYEYKVCDVTTAQAIAKKIVANLQEDKDENN